MEISSEQKQYFTDLLQEDREANLIERIEYYSKSFPETYHRKIGFAQIVYNNFWVVIPINGENFAFSVGMDYSFDLPDVMVIADNLSQKDFQVLINEINCFARDNGELDLNRDYTKEIIMKEELDFDTYPEDANKPEGERRLKTKKGKEFKLVNIEKPLIFKEYTQELEKQFPCGYLYNFNYFFTDNDSVKVIVADLR